MIYNRPLTIALVAGEFSGDILGAGIIRAIKKRVNNIRFVGIAGPLMQREGCEAWYKTEELSIMGITEILRRLHRLLYIRTDLTRRFSKLNPDIFIGIDAPDFNITLESNLKKQGIKTIHYVSPSVWAWREKRIIKIGKSTHLVLVLFPFEKTLYDKFNVLCKFVGHTIADRMPLDPDKNATRKLLGISQNVYCLALLPGSRSLEIKMMSGIFLKAAQILQNYCPNLNIIVPLASNKYREQFKHIKNKVAPGLCIRLLNGKGREAMIASDVALLTSGTATLECMLAKCPMIVCYRMKKLTYWLVKHFIKTKYISLPNLLSNRKLIKEFLQEECQPQALATALLQLLIHNKNHQKIYNIFRKLHQKIRCNADEQVADIILKLINNELSLNNKE